MKVLVLAYGDGTAASTLYRYRAGEALWRESGHRLDIVPVRGLTGSFWREVTNYDVIINQKALLPGGFARRLRATGRPVFFDLDDAIWTRPQKPYSWWTQRRVNGRIRQWFSGVQGIFAANRYLADYARQLNPAVEVLPMALDLEVWRPAPQRGDGMRIGWAGSPGNLWHLERLREPLSALLRANPKVQLAVFCGRRPAFEFPFEYVPYAPGAERDFVAGLDIGLLPLEFEAYSLGKSPIKALQYLSCGVPVVGNVAGATAELLNEDNSVAIGFEAEWLPTLEQMVASPGRLREMGEAGRKFVERRHDLRKEANRLMTFLARQA